MPDLRIAAEHLVRGRKLLIHFAVEPRAIRAVVRRANEMVGRSRGGIDGSLCIVLGYIWIVAEEILNRRIPARLRNLVIDKGNPVPAVASRGLTEGVLAEGCGRRVIDRVQASKVKIAAKHFG